jgi:hypothetical protein
LASHFEPGKKITSVSKGDKTISAGENATLSETFELSSSGGKPCALNVITGADDGF